MALKASKGPGKTFIEAIAIQWFLVTRPFANVACTSVTGDNLKDGLWKELSNLQARSTLLSRLFKHTSESFEMVGRDERGVRLGSRWFCSARTWPKDGGQAAQANTLAGLHQDSIMFVLDEVGDIPGAVMASAKAALANKSEKDLREAKLLIAGNPTQTQGPLWDACMGPEAELWKVYEISGDPDDPMRAPRVSIEWARETIREYGRDSDIVLVNVFGRFPKGQSNTIVWMEDARAAAKRVPGPRTALGYPRILGVDVARYGDGRTVIQPRQGPIAFQPHVMREASTMQVVGQVGSIIERWRPQAVFIDVGGVGGGVVDRLIEKGFAVEGVDFGSKPWRPRFKNLRAQMWFDLAQWIREGGCIPNDDVLIRELCAPTYKFLSESVIQMESKEDMKKRQIPSPDWGDALALTFALPVEFPDKLDEVREMHDVPLELRKRGVRRPADDWDYNPWLEERA